MMRAVWNGAVPAETDRTVVVEGNHCFPPGSLPSEYFAESRAESLCCQRGLARSYTVTVDGQANAKAAWYYPHPIPLVKRIKNHVAFWNGVTVEAPPEPGR
jgi:uncharacterized protein (DUF427 family)